jgi:exosortase A
MSASAPQVSTLTTVLKHWHQTFLVLILLLAWTILLYRDTGIAMVTLWERSETFTHGFLVPPIVLWLIWRQRQVLAGLSPQPALGTFFVVAAAAFVWLLGDLVAVNAVTQLAFTSLLVLVVPALLGWPIARQIAFPLGFLFFAVPIGEFFLPQLMEWTANFTVLALRLSGIPVYREGLQFVIPSGNWSVVEACSGVRYLIASLTVGTLFAYLNYRSAKRRLLFVIVSILVPIVANWMRAYMIVMLGHLSGNKLAVGVDHLIYGWVFFGIVIMLMFMIGARWSEPDTPAGSGAKTPYPAQRPAAASTRFWIATSCYALMVAAPHMVLSAIYKSEAVGALSFTVPSALAVDWQAGSPSENVDFKPAFQNPSGEINTTYVSRGHSVGLYLGYYRHQNYDRKLVSSNNVLVASRDSKWSLVGTSNRAVTLAEKSVAVRTAVLRGADLSAKSDEWRLEVWQLYWINGTLTTNDYLAKVYSAFYRLTGGGDDSAVIIVYTLKDQAGGGDAVLASFLATNYAAINELLLNTRQSK